MLGFASAMLRRSSGSAALAAALLLVACSRGDRHERAAAPPAEPVAQPAAAGDAAPPAPTARSFASAAEAVQTVLAETHARVVGFGEQHELRGATVQSALTRFDRDVAPALIPHLSDLIVEIWARDACGDKSAAVNRNVQQMTQRPATTENQVVKLMTMAKSGGVQNHVIHLSCADYDSILDGKGEVNYEKLLLLVTEKLLQVADGVLTAREKQGPPAPGRTLIALYGGALHNNLYPYESTADLTYAPRLSRRAGDRYVEIDLYVPELIEGDELLRSEEWYPVFEKQQSSERVTLIQRGPRSYILVLRKGLAKQPAAAQPKVPR